MATPDPPPWLTETLRLSAFVSNPQSPEATYLWQDLLGRPPTERRSQPQQQLLTEHGPFLTGLLRANIQNNRSDWHLSPDPQTQPHQLPTLGLYSAIKDQFSNLMLQWLSTCPDLTRLAFGAIFLLPAKDHADSYERLASFLPNVTIDSVHSRDFIYRINRRRPSHSGLDGLTINRLSTWASVQVVETIVDLSIMSPGQAPVMQNVNARHFCRLELDINTAPEYGRILNSSTTQDLFSELAAYAEEIMINGDVP